MIVFQIILVALMLLGLIIWSARAQAGKSLEMGNKLAVTSQKVQAMSRDDIQRALKRIATKSPPPQKMGAMCYEMTVSADYMEYICPLDGEKTVYAKGSQALSQVEDLAEVKRLLEELRLPDGGISISLDERELCSRCFPDLTDADRKVFLVIRYADGRTVRTGRVSPDDIRYLKGFFSGGLSYRSFNESEVPLRSVEGRLKELLGEN